MELDLNTVWIILGVVVFVSALVGAGMVYWGKTEAVFIAGIVLMVPALIVIGLASATGPGR